MNLSNRWGGLAPVVKNQAITKKCLIGKYFPRVSGFSQRNLQKNQDQKDAISAGPKYGFLPQSLPMDN